MKTFKEYIENGKEINEANKEFDKIVDMISDDWHKRVYIVKFLGERNGLKLFEYPSKRKSATNCPSPFAICG